MMKTLILSLLIISLINCDKLQDRIDAINALEKLKASKLGGDVYTSILLEMEASNEQNGNDRINDLLNDLYEEFRELRENQFGIKSTKFAFCVTKISDLTDDLEAHELKLAKATQRIPQIEEQQGEADLLVIEKKSEIKLNENAITELHEQNNDSIAANEANLQEHRDMIDALQQAKELIKQLAVSSFLQKGGFSETSLVQIQEIKKTLQKSHQVGMITALVSMAQNIQADQGEVSHILSIIDELIGYEQNAIAFENGVEQKRLALFEYNLARFTALGSFLEASIKDCQADAITYIVTYARRVQDLQADIIDYNAVIADKTEQKTLQDKACNDDLAAMEGRIEEYNDITDLIRAVMRLFKSSTMRDVQEVLAEVN